MQTINNSTAEIFKLKEVAKKLKNLESSQQETEYFIHQQLQALEKKQNKLNPSELKP